MDSRYVRDLATAMWIRERLHPFAQDVGSVIPDTFASYARVFHPAYRGADHHPVRWQDVAAGHGRVAHPLMQFGNIAGDWRRSAEPTVWTEPPRVGTLTQPLAGSLAAALRPHTSTPGRCWFAVWEGWGGLERPSGVPLFEIPSRRYLVVAGPLEDADRSFHPLAYQSASMWWPDDRSWFVSTEVDFEYTYVGGTRECIDAVLQDPGIEALPAHTNDDPSYASDDINPAPRSYR